MSYTIVAIDDDKKVTVFIKKGLVKSGHTVFTADDGTIGLKLIKEKNPDLIICDMQIPGIHGAELARQLRNDPEYKNLKIILMTSVYRKINWLLDLKSWTDGFIEKPFDILKLIELIDSIMNKKTDRKIVLGQSS